MIDPEVQWTAPAPLWPALETTPETFAQPTMLRFATDSFMQDFLEMLEQDPARLGDLRARPETWRGLVEESAPIESAPLFARPLNRLRLARLRAANKALSLSNGSNGSQDLTTTGAPKQALKLYQPGHQRYYLVTSCLVCRLPGLPDHGVDSGRQERVGFVMRRLFPPAGVAATECTAKTCDEYAFVLGKWQKVTGPETPTAESLGLGEEQLPLFPAGYTEDGGRRRRLLAGVIPVGKREAYLAATKKNPALPPSGPQEGATTRPVPKSDPRMMLLYTQITEPWKRLLERADTVRNIRAGAPAASPPPSNDELNDLIKETREQLQTVSWYVLLDFAMYLEKYLNDVWKAVADEEPDTSVADPDRSDLLDNLTNTTLSLTLINSLTADTTRDDGTVIQSAYTIPAVKTTLRAALKAVLPLEGRLERVTKPYDRNNPDPDWPEFLFPLADPVTAGPLPPFAVSASLTDLEEALERVEGLAESVRKGLPAETTQDMPGPSAVALPIPEIDDPGWFVIRCVYERPSCGPLDPPVVSKPSREFQLAGFFDPDAPARPIRIAMPMDTSPAGLRKFDKNTVFMMSDMLCGQVDRLKALTLGDLVLSVLPWPFHKNLSIPDKGPCTEKGTIPPLEIGMICSLSIPIITICALILLMIIVSLLDMIFRWMPYFLICFPLPKFKSKGSS